MINLGFIGVGGMGRHQVKSFGQVRGVRIVAGADVSAQSRRRFAQIKSKATLYADHRDLLADNRVDAVVVAVPTFHHARIAIDAVKSGRAVLVEKPMARTVADARRMVDAAHKTCRLLMVAHCRRFDSDWGTFAKLYYNDTLGQPILWRSVSGNPGPGSWYMDAKLGGGPLMDGAVHNYDFANMLFGDPKTVFASSIKLTNATAVDTASALVHYESANQLLVSASWGTASSGGALHDALGPKGSALFGPGKLDGLKLDTQRYGYYRLTNCRSHKSRLVRFTRKDMYVTQARHFIDCIVGKTACRSPGTEAIKAVAVAEAILKSSLRDGGRKVSW